jgi:hypothetical protein
MTSTSTLWSSTYVDHVFTYIGFNYTTREAAQAHLTLYGINELARKNRLILCRRQISNRDVRILIENPNNKNTETKNYEKFLFNFNKLSIACYLTALQSNESIWSTFNIPLNLAKDTNFYVIESSPTINERKLRKTLSDKEFLTNYLETICNLHMNVSNCLYLNLNRNLPVNADFSDDFYSHESVKKDVHLFRSFRLLGLRHRINNDNSNNSKTTLDPFNEIIEIRCSFDIKQFNNRTGYDCFIECEISYYEIKPHNFTLNEHKWFSYLNCNNVDAERYDGNLGRIEEQYENHYELRSSKRNF